MSASTQSTAADGNQENRVAPPEISKENAGLQEKLKCQDMQYQVEETFTQQRHYADMQKKTHEHDKKVQELRGQLERALQQQRRGDTTATSTSCQQDEEDERHAVCHLQPQ